MSKLHKFFFGGLVICKSGIFFAIKKTKIFMTALSRPFFAISVHMNTLKFGSSFSPSCIMHVLGSRTRANIATSIIKRIVVYVVNFNSRICQLKNFTMHINLAIVLSGAFSSLSIQILSTCFNAPLVFRQPFKIYIVNESNFILGKADCFHVA